MQAVGELVAGRAMDSEIAKLLGWRSAGDDPFRQWGNEGAMWTAPDWTHWVRLPDFSTDIAAAWTVVEHLLKTAVDDVRIQGPSSGTWRVSFSGAFAPYADWGASADTLPLAICRAALLAGPTAVPPA